MEKIHVLTTKPYDIILGNNILKDFGLYIKQYSKVLIITDNNIPLEYIETIKTNITSEIFTYVVKAGEDAKSLENYQNIISYLLEKNFSRKDLIINLGGGVISDLGGFIASTYKRGMDYVNVPTTTLSMVDSSIGGKVAINFNGYKNMIGVFNQPNLVYIDMTTLSTLSKRHYYNGLVEALKMALLSSSEMVNFFNDIDENLLSIIYQSLMFKKKIVEEDEKDTSIRQILNFGHTIGHAVEAKYLHSIYHGEAVAYGMIPFIDDLKVKQQVLQIFQKMGISIDNIRYQNLYAYLIQDKKTFTEQNEVYINIIKLKNIGNPYIEKMNIKTFN